MSTSALIVMDYINEIAHPRGKRGIAAEFIEKNSTLANVNALIQWSREEGHLLAFVIIGFSTGYPECPKNSPVFGKAKENGVLQLGSWGTQILDFIDFQKQDPVIIKHRVSGFYGTKLEPLLRANCIDHLYLAGVSTDMVVQSTARDAHDRDYAVTIVKDACAAATEDNHEMALKLSARIAQIVNTKDLIS